MTSFRCIKPHKLLFHFTSRHRNRNRIQIYRNIAALQVEGIISVKHLKQVSINREHFVALSNTIWNVWAINVNILMAGHPWTEIFAGIAMAIFRITSAILVDADFCFLRGDVGHQNIKKTWSYQLEIVTTSQACPYDNTQPTLALYL